MNDHTSTEMAAVHNSGPAHNEPNSLSAILAANIAKGQSTLEADRADGHLAPWEAKEGDSIQVEEPTDVIKPN